MNVLSIRRLVKTLTAVFLMTTALGSPAATWVVDSTSASPGLSSCTAAANDCSFPGAVSRLGSTGDSITFTVASSDATEVFIAKDVVIEAAGARLLRLVISTSVGWATVTVRNAVWQYINSGSPFGGAMYIAPSQIVTIEDSQFLFNRTGNTGKGGAIHNFGILTVRRSRFEGNHSPQGAGAIYHGVSPSPNPSSLTVLDSVFRANGVLDPTGPSR
ncbi:MAG: hypothetical protein IPK97_09950 [Ahniella sp.]|nr:hypothetical protein [Ahniella sp.]